MQCMKAGGAGESVAEYGKCHFDWQVQAGLADLEVAYEVKAKFFYQVRP